MYPYIKVFLIEIPTYGLCMVCATMLVTILSVRTAKRKGICLEDVIIVSAMSIGFALAGAKLLYIAVTYEWKEIYSFVQNGNYEFLSGSGLVFLGGLLTGLLGAVVGSRITNRKLYEYETSIVPYIPLGHAIGRLGCFFVGCCYGMPYNGPCAIYYMEGERGYFPIQPVESFYNVVICALLYKMSRKQRAKYGLLKSYLCLYAIGRFILEFLRGDLERGVFLHLSTAQWMCIGIVLSLMVEQFFKKGQKKNETMD